MMAAPAPPTIAAPVRNADAAALLPVPKAFLNRETPIPMRFILKAGAVYFQVSEQQIKSAARSKEICDTRKIIAYVMAGLSGQSLAQIGRFMNRDHTTIMHALDCIKRLYGFDEAVTDTIDRFCNCIIASQIKASPDIEVFDIAQDIVNNPRLALTASLDSVRAMAAVVHTIPDLRMIVAQLETDLALAKQAEQQALHQARKGMLDAIATPLQAWITIMDDLEKDASPRAESALRVRLARASETLHKALKTHLKG
jgi:hypothetical protein